MGILIIFRFFAKQQELLNDYDDEEDESLEDDCDLSESHDFKIDENNSKDLNASTRSPRGSI